MEREIYERCEATKKLKLRSPANRSPSPWFPRFYPFFRSSPGSYDQGG